MARKPASKKTTNQEAAELPIKDLKKATCKTLVGTSTLGYQLGLDEDDNLHWRIESNTGGGMFSNEWVSHADIEAAFEARPEDNAINSMTLRPLLRGKSVNTPALQQSRTADGSGVSGASDPK